MNNLVFTFLLSSIIVFESQAQNLILIISENCGVTHNSVWLEAFNSDSILIINAGQYSWLEIDSINTVKILSTDKSTADPKRWGLDGMMIGALAGAAFGLFGNFYINPSAKIFEPFIRVMVAGASALISAMLGGGIGAVMATFIKPSQTERSFHFTKLDKKYKRQLISSLVLYCNTGDEQYLKVFE